MCARISPQRQPSTPPVLKVRFLPYISGRGSVCASSYMATTATVALGARALPGEAEALAAARRLDHACPRRRVSAFRRRTEGQLFGRAEEKGREPFLRRGAGGRCPSSADDDGARFFSAPRIWRRTAPRGLPPITRAQQPSTMSAMSAAQYPVEEQVARKQRLPVAHAVRNGGQGVVGEGDACIFGEEPVDAAAERPASEGCPVQLFTYPRRRQKKHSSAERLAVDGDAGLRALCSAPRCPRSPRCRRPRAPTVTPTFARGTAPRRICTSLVQGEASVMRMTASFPERKGRLLFLRQRKFCRAPYR